MSASITNLFRTDGYTRRGAGQMYSLPMCLLVSSLGKASSLCSELPGKACPEGDSVEWTVQHCHTHIWLCHSAIIPSSQAIILLSGFVIQQSFDRRRSSLLYYSIEPIRYLPSNCCSAFVACKYGHHGRIAYN